MKSITVTTHRATNYGAALQAYALQQFQQSLGIKNQLLQLPPVVLRANYHSLRSILISAFRHLYAILHRSDASSLKRKFQAFAEQFFITTSQYANQEELGKNPPKADFFVCGSDQVFSLRSPQSYARLMRFVPQGQAKFSYAASLGEYDWTVEEENEFASVLNTFSDISVREEYAKDYLSKLTDKPIRVNMDPVFLLESTRFSEIAIKPACDEPYILVYPLLSNDAMQELINKAKATLGYKTVLVRVSNSTKYQCDEYVFDAGPREFLGLISNATAIITTSFHGTAFSIIYNKPFYVMTKNYKSQRITDLLRACHLEDRHFSKGDSVNFDVDFEFANEKIVIEREAAKAYFHEMMETARQ